MTRDLPIYDSAQRRTPLVSEVKNFWSYRGLIRLLVVRDLTVRYKRSVLGVWWTLLNPLLTTAVFWVIFGQLFAGRFGSTGDEPYVLYLLAGVLMMTFFQQGVMSTGSSITNSRDILAKVFVPAEVFAFSTAVAAAANFVISLLPLIAVLLITGNGIPLTAPLAVLPMAAMLLLVVGAGMLVASAAIFFHDVIDLTRVIVQLLTYLTPVFWPIDIVPDRFLPFVKANPLFSFLDAFRDLMYRGELPGVLESSIMVGSSLVLFVLGVWAFSKAWLRKRGQL